MASTLRDLAARPVSDVPGVGKLAVRLESMGLETVLDLLQHYPRRYLDRTKRAEIAELAPGDEATVFAEVRAISSRRSRQGRAIVEATVHDGTSLLTVTFFNQQWRDKQLPVGTEAAFFGKVDMYRGKRQLVNPAVDVLGRLGANTGAVIPVYPQSGKAEVFTAHIRKLMEGLLDSVGELADPLSPELRAELKVPDRTWAYRHVHLPTSMEDVRRAVRRLKFEEFLRMQLGLVARKRAIERDQAGVRHVVDGVLLDRFLASLPFEPTGDQRRTIDEILRDLAAPGPMHRLLQGEVGSGKTIVALAALLVGVQGGHQGAFMAPTEVLAEQHYAVARELLDGLVVPSDGTLTLTGDRPVTVALLTNRTPAAERRKLSAGLAAGDIDIVVGTHALIYGDLGFRSLGVVVVDEQHRFGVEQRALLRGQGTAPEVIPDVLVMTATPIPRTAAFLVYGDLDKSELREMPKGRNPITTRVVPPTPLDHAEAFATLRAEVEQGRQAFVVCPLVDGSVRVEAKAATEELERLREEELRGLRLGLLHGQLPAKEKESVMAAFRAGELDVLVATTVIEVGVDVPNATVMLVEDADRFGLSQLHQLRGRVGRGQYAGTCLLFSDAATPDAERRMEAMANSADGFELAEYDLEIRGAGEVFGERQSGFSDLKLGRIPRYERYVLAARDVAERILDDDPMLSEHRQLGEEVSDLLGDDVDFLFKS